MFINILKEIEKDYSYKKTRAEKEYDLKKQELYLQNPRLLEIDQAIAENGIKATKLALISNMSEKETCINQLKQNIQNLKIEKENILKVLNIELKPNYECTKCNDSGYVFINNRYEMCSCFRQQLIQEAYNNSNLLNLQNENFDKFDISLYSNIANVEIYKSKISPRENIQNIKELSIKFIENFSCPHQKNLLFSGTPGVGKTFLSGCIANEILKKGYTVLYQTAPLLFDSILRYKYSNIENSFKELYESLYTVNLLIIDDLGTEDLSNSKFKELFSILNTRSLKADTKTIISTNLSIQDIASTYDLRIVSRIIGNYDICMFFGEDIRLKKK